MLKRITKIISWCFHPLLMPTIGIILLLYSNSYLSFIPVQAKNMLILLAAIGTFILPALMMPFFLMQGRISNFEISERTERNFPMALTSVLYLLTFLLFLRIPVFSFLHAYMLGAFLSVFLASMISLKWKISSHMIGLGGLSALILIASFKFNVNLYYSLLGVLMASGLTASSRLYLKAHSPLQIYVGYFTGLIITSLCLLIY